MILNFINYAVALSDANKQKLYYGCYPLSKQYLGEEKAKNYCNCTVNLLSKKFNDEEMEKISNENAEKQIQAFNFASTSCSNKLGLN
tara:strand:+ start:384 stop:644 length:261 start_codon:yes stop_codon:yes gene_type:complete